MNTAGQQRALQLVREIATIHLEGNITPHTWYKHIRHEDGKPDLPAITILSEIVYWYRPSVEKDERGNVIRYLKRFHEDKLRKSYKDLGETFGLTKRQVRSAVEHLEKIGVITTELRTTIVNGVLCNNVLYIELVPEKLRELCLPPDIEIKVFTPPTPHVTAPMTSMSHPIASYVTPYDTVCQTNTEITSETTQRSFNPASVEADTTPAKKERKKRSTPLPVDFSITPEMRAWASQNAPNVNLEAATESFRNDAIAKDKRFADWSAAWRNWIGNARDWGKHTRQGPQQQRIDQSPPAKISYTIEEETRLLQAKRIGDTDTIRAIEQAARQRVGA